MKRVQTTLNSFFIKKKRAIPEHRIPSLVVTIGCQYIKYKSLNQITQNQIGHFFKLQKLKVLNKCPIRETTKLAFFEEEKLPKVEQETLSLLLEEVPWLTI